MAIGQETAITSIVLIYYVVASAVARFRRKPPSEDPCTKSTEPNKPRLWKSLLGASVLTIVASSVESTIQGIIVGGLSKNVNDRLFSDLLFAVTWVILLLGLIHSKGEAAYPHAGAWALSILARAAYTLPRRYHSHDKQLQTVSIAIMAQSTAVLLTIVVGMLQRCLQSSAERDQSPESQPLLKDQNKTTGTEEPDKEEGEEKEESDEDSARKEIRDRPFWKYVTSFKIFTPFMLPDTLRQRFYFGGMCTCSAVERGVNILRPLSLGAVVNGLTHGHIPWKRIFVYSLLSLLSSSTGVSLLSAILYLRLSQEQGLALNRAAYGHIMDLSANFQDSKSSASVWQTLYQARSVVALFHDICFNVIPAVFDLVAGFFVLSGLFGGYMGLLLTTSIVSFLWLTVNALPPKAELQRKHREAYIAEFYQLVQSSSNWHTVTQFGQMPREKEQFRTKGQATQDANLASANFSYWTRSTRVFVHMIAFFGACCLVVIETSKGEQKVGDFVVLISFWAQLTSPLTGLVEDINLTLEKLVDAERMLVLLEKTPAVQDSLDATEFVYLGGAVEFEDVHFSYDGKRNATEGTSFRALAGETTAIVGQTGGGKSTLVKLLFRFYDPEKGRILIDGQDLKGLKMDSFRKHIGIVPQDPALFNTTILDNVRYPDLSLGEEEVQAACKAVALHDKIMTFKKGYLEKCGERGCRLSGGELQRLAIARAILKRPDILLLDEATSSVDSLTESKIQKSLDELCRGKTTFVIAHRLSTILKADQILVVDAGKIVECGTHSELLQKKGAYHKLWTTQLKLQSDADKEADAKAKKESITLINDLSESHDESTELIRVTSEGDKDKLMNGTPDPDEVNGRREELEEKTATKQTRGRQTVKERIRTINRRESCSPSSKRDREEDLTTPRTRSTTGSRLQANAPEFIPRRPITGQQGGFADLSSGVTVRNKKGSKAKAAKTDERRSLSEPAARDGSSEMGDDVETGDEGDTAKYSRIPRRNRQDK